MMEKADEKEKKKTAPLLRKERDGLKKGMN